MREYKHHIFYKHKHLSVDEKIKLMYEAYELSYNTWVDKLDCNESWVRQKINMSFDDVIKYFNNGCHFVIIQRNGYDEPHGEIGFSTLGSNPEYFLWIKLYLNEFNGLVTRFNISE